MRQKQQLNLYPDPDEYIDEELDEELWEEEVDKWIDDRIVEEALS
jgi:hypothetical protein